MSTLVDGILLLVFSRRDRSQQYLKQACSRRSTTLDSWTEDQLKVGSATCLASIPPLQLCCVFKWRHACLLVVGWIKESNSRSPMSPVLIQMENLRCYPLQTMMVGSNQRARQFFKQHGWSELGADKISAKVTRKTAQHRNGFALQNPSESNYIQSVTILTATAFTSPFVTATRARFAVGHYCNSLVVSLHHSVLNIYCPPL